jgi:hypothetical protein
VAAYRTVAVATIARRLAGDDLAEIAAAHRRQVDAAFAVLSAGLATR